MTDKTILLVDDEENIISALTRLLRRDGYNILRANSGQAGLELLAQHRVGVIISDQRMPGMTGTEFLTKVREIYPDTIRIVLSGYTELNSVTDAINRGAVYKFFTKPWEDEMRTLLASSPFGRDGKVWGGKDLWHLRSLMFTEPVDFLIGNSYGKYLERDTGTPLIRFAFPIFDRHHHHRFPLWGYQGGLRVLTTLLDKIFDKLDRETSVTAKTDFSFDLTR